MPDRNEKAVPDELENGLEMYYCCVRDRRNSYNSDDDGGDERRARYVVCDETI